MTKTPPDSSVTLFTFITTPSPILLIYVNPDMFSIVGTGSTAEITLFYIAVISINGLIG